MKKEFLLYLVIGVASVMVDFLSYLFFLNFFSLSISKLISYILGMLIGFFCNRFFTFKSKNKIHKDAFKVATLYSSSLFLNVVVNKLLFIVLPGFITLSFIVATLVTIVINYLGQKFWVYK